MTASEPIADTVASRAAEREAFLAARRQGIGGSDASSLFNIGWGCRRRLWYDKTGVEPDYPRAEGWGPLRRGQMLEDIVAAEYSEMTGRAVVKRAAFTHPQHPELRVNIDREIHSPHRPADSGYLEIKVLGRETFHKTSREGLPEDYRLQHAHGLLVTGFQWGAFCILSPELYAEPLAFDLERDNDLCELVREAGVEFWSDCVVGGAAPERLDAEDHRCGSCEYRLSCQGEHMLSFNKPGSTVPFDDSLRPLALEYLNRRELVKEAKELLDETAEELKARLGERTEVLAGGSKILYRAYSVKEHTVRAHVKRPLNIYAEKKR